MASLPLLPSGPGGVQRFLLHRARPLVTFDGGEGGIRTHGPVARTAVFETARFGHSRTSPRSHPPTPSAITPAHPEPAKTGFWPVGRAPSRAHPGPAKTDPFPMPSLTSEQ